MLQVDPVTGCYTCKCIKCKNLRCHKSCPYGFVLNRRGCPKCECKQPKKGRNMSYDDEDDLILDYEVRAVPDDVTTKSTNTDLAQTQDPGCNTTGSYLSKI